jgi:hypothetical protein
MTIGEDVWRSHAEQLGRIALAWNSATMQLLRVFSHLTGLGSPLADVLFFSHKSDQSQRGLIKAVAALTDIPEADHRTLLRILKALDGVSVGRNLATHTIFSMSLVDPDTNAWGPKIVPALTPPQDPRLQVDFDAQFAKVEADLVALQRHLENWLLHTPFPSREWSGPPFLGPLPGDRP